MGLLTAKLTVAGDKSVSEATIMFDTGASHSFIRRELAERIATISPLPRSLRFTVGDGRTIEITDQATILIEIPGTTVLDIMMVIDQGVEEIVLGASTMRKHGLKIDLEHGSVFAEIKEEFLMPTKLGDFLRATRERKELSAADVASAGGIEESTYRAIEAGEIARPPDNRLRGFAEALDVSFDALKDLLPADELREEREDGMEAVLKSLLTRLGIEAKEGMSDEQAIAAIVDHKAPAPAKTPIVSPAVLGLLELSETATEDEVQGKILALKNPGNVVPAEQLQTLQAQLHKRDIEDAVNTALSEGKIMPAEKAGWLEEITSGKITLATFKSFVANRPKLVPLSEQLPKDDPKKPERIDDTQATINRQLSVSDEVFAKYNQA